MWLFVPAGNYSRETQMELKCTNLQSLNSKTMEIYFMAVRSLIRSIQYAYNNTQYMVILLSQEMCTLAA